MSSNVVSTLFITDFSSTEISLATREGVTDPLGNRVHTEGLINHPTITFRLSNFYQGTVEIGEIECEVYPTGGTVLTALTDIDLRGLTATIEILDISSGTPTAMRSISGKVQNVSRTGSGTFRITVSEANDALLSTLYPKMVVSGDLFGSEETNSLDLNLPIPIVLGATREHIPCRYIEEDFTNERFRYVYGCDLSTSTTAQPVVIPYPNTVYQSINAKPSIVPSRSYIIERDVEILEPVGLQDNGTTSGTLTANTYRWKYTVINGVGETTPSAAFTATATFNGSTVGAQKMIWRPQDRPTATGFRFYRETGGNGVYGLVAEINDPSGYRTTDSEGNEIFEFVDDGLDADTLRIPPNSNTTRGGLCSILFNRLQHGQSSQLVPLTADVEYTEIASRTDTLGLWLFRDGEVRDIAVPNNPRPVSSKMSSFWDFSEQLTASGTFNPTNQTFAGTPATILDRVGSAHMKTSGPFSSDNYAVGIQGHAAITGLDVNTHGLVIPSASATPFQFNSTTSFRVNITAKPEVGTGDKTMVLMQKNIGGINKTWLLGIKEGNVWGLVGDQFGTTYEAVGTTAADGGWHEFSLEVTREGSVQGTPPVPSPRWYYSAPIAFENQQYPSMYIPHSSGLNTILSVSVATRDKTQVCTPTSVKYNNVALNHAVTASAGTDNPYLSTSIWDLVVPSATATGVYQLLVTFPSSSIPKSTVVTATALWFMNQGSGTTYRDITGTNSSTGATSSTISVTPTESQGKSFCVDCLNIPTHTVSPVSVGGTFRVSQYIDGTHKMRASTRTQPETSSGAQDSKWNLSSSQRLAHAAVWYKPLPSATGNDIKHDYLNVYLDGELEWSTVIDGVGSLASTGTANNHIQIGTGGRGEFFEGDIDSANICVGVSGSAIDLPFSFVNGKSNSSLNALVCTSGTGSPYVASTNRSDAYGPGTTSFTVEGWYQLTTLGVDQVIASWGSSTHGWVLGVNSSNQPYFTLRRNGANTTTTSTEASILSRWYFVSAAVTRETAGVAGAVRLYHDDNAEVSTTLTAATPVDLSVSGSLSLGGDRTSGSLVSPFRGYIDELHIFAGVRSAADAKRIWGLGVRNIAAQLRQFLESSLHGPGVTIEAASFNAAATSIKTLAGPSASDANKFVTDFAWVEQQPLRDHLEDVLRVRGLRTGLTATGSWTLTVDKDPGVTPSAYSFADGVIENISDRPEWKNTNLRDIIKTFKVRYRIRRNSTGGIDGHVLRTSQRSGTSATVGKDDELTINCIRDRETADRYADYISKRLIAGDLTVTFETGEDGRFINLGDVITVTDKTRAPAAFTMQVSEIRIQGTRHTIEAIGWSSSAYSYEAGRLPLDVSPESEPSFEAEVPLPPTDVAGSYSYSSVDKTNVKFEVTWTPPTRLYAGARISYRQTKSNGTALDDGQYLTPWKYGIEVDKKNTGKIRFGVLITPSGTNSFKFGVQTRSPSGIYSAFAVSDEITVTNT